MSRKKQWLTYLNSVDGKRKFKEKDRGFLPEKWQQRTMGNVGSSADICVWYGLKTIALRKATFSGNTENNEILLNI